MCDEFSRLTIRDIERAMTTYSNGDEKETTTNYFIFNEKNFPIMRIIKSAMEINGSFGSKDYDNLHCCKKTIMTLLNLSEDDLKKKKN